MAKRLKTPEKLRTLQKKLYLKAKREPEFRFYLLYDKVYRPDILEYAYRLCRSRRGSPGVDGVRFEDIEAAGAEDWLRALAEELREGRYKPQPVRRVMIPKAGGGERPLGIPTIRDRVVQTAAVLVLEPIFEADFEPNAYGYRPNRSALDAVKEVHEANRRGESYVVDADLSGYESFDFLGYTFGPRWSTRLGRMYPGVAPSKKAVAQAKQRLRAVLRPGNLAPAPEVVAMVNRRLEGWANYFRVGTRSEAYKVVDFYSSTTLRRFLVRRHKTPGRGVRRFSWEYLHQNLGLVCLEDRYLRRTSHALK